MARPFSKRSTRSSRRSRRRWIRRCSALEHAGTALEQRNFMLISNFLRPFERRLSTSAAWPGVLAKARLHPALP
jgi:hypothetical protein